jgi:hypothetical protein|tara:strand:+ start:203 stop:439 length:237 start_codon:yes stop_codon:yes gene_type:complete
MENKLGSYISNLMTTIVDKEERFFVRKLAFDELVNLYHAIIEFTGAHEDEMYNPILDGDDEKDKNQLEIKFGEKNENK